MTAAAPAIAVRGLRKSFGDVDVLHGVDFEVEPGRVFALLGSNGAGKTTVVRILATLLRPDSGTATVDGFDVVDRAADVRESISLTGQFAAVDEILTGRENLVLVARLRHVTDPAGVAADLLARFDLTDAADRRASTYSGGMRRRLDIAMSLVGDPRVIVLDEPTTGLDVTTQSVIMDLITELGRQRGMAMMLITHDLGMAAEYCNRVVVMHAGHVVETAPGRDLFARPRHPYSAKLLAATPGETASLAELASIPGGLPDLRRADLPACRYSGRCERRLDDCAKPLTRRVFGDRHLVACWNPL